MNEIERKLLAERLLAAARTGALGRRQFMQGMLAAGLTAAGATSVWTGEVQAAMPKKGGTLRVGKGHGQTSDSLDPATWENGFMLALGHAVHGYLTEVKPDGSVGPHLAESWEASADASTWTFALRSGATFHDGSPVTAAHVVAAINHHRGDDSKSAAKPIVAPIKSIRADGDTRVVFELEAGNADFPFIVSDYHLPVLPMKDGKPDWRSGNGAGGYRLTSFDPGVRADMTRNPDYYRADHAHVDGIEMLAIVDPAARMNALVSGEVHAIDRVDVKTVALLKRRPGMSVHSVTGTQHYTFPMHTTVAPYSDNNVRMALKHGIDRQEMVDKILQGYGSVGNDHPIGSGVQYFARDLEQRTFDPDRAKFYLDKAGLKSLEVSLSAADAAFAGAVDAAQLYSETARKSGITLKVVREPNDGYWSNVWLKKPFCACYWGGRPTCDWMFSTAYERGVAWNDTYWDHDRFNVLLKEARAELDQAKRGDMYFEMQQLVRDEGGTVVPMFASYVFATSDKVGRPDAMASNWDMDGERWMERWWLT